MMWTGRLRYTNNGASLLRNPNPPFVLPLVPPQVLLVIQGGLPNPVFAATNFLQGKELENNEQIVVTGMSSEAGDVRVILMADAQRAVDVADHLAAAGVFGAAKKGSAKKGGAMKGGAKKAAKKGSSSKTAGAKGGKKASAKSAAKKSPSKKSGAKKSASKSARKGGKKQR